METLSELQARLSPPYRDGRSFDTGIVYLSELFFAFFEEDGRNAWFHGESQDLRGILHQLVLIGSSLNIDIGVVVRKKYRDRCPRCRQKPCICWDWKEKPRYYPYPGPLPMERTLAQTQQILNKVFPKRHPLAEEVEHLADEMGELAEAIESGNKEGINEEIADVFAWLARIANTLGISLDEQGPV